MYQPMAVAIMFGLIFSTALTLGVVPVLYSLFFKVSYKDFVVLSPLGLFRRSVASRASRAALASCYAPNLRPTLS